MATIEMATIQTWAGHAGTIGVGNAVFTGHLLPAHIMAGRSSSDQLAQGQSMDSAVSPARRPPAGQIDAPARKRHAVTQISGEERARVFRQAKRHSILVRILRFGCPVAALLSCGLYFTHKRIEIEVPGGKIVVPIPTLSGENLKMEDPRYEGFTADGAKFTVTAKTGYQDFRNTARIRLITIDSHLAQVNDEWAHLISNEGIYDTKADLLDLSGDIKVTSSNGMTVYMKTASVQTKAQIVTTKDPVIVEMRNGTTVESDGLVLNAKTKEVTFEGNVRSHLVRDGSGKAGMEAEKEADSGAKADPETKQDTGQRAATERDDAAAATPVDAQTASHRSQQGARP